MRADADFGINGRFLTQKVTGVQRYARNVVGALADASAGTRSGMQLLAPAGTAAPKAADLGTTDPGYAAIPLVTFGPLTGHAWEQVTLPARWRGRLLNLCNTAPVAKADQIICIHDANVFLAPESYSQVFRRFYGLLQPLLARRAARLTTVSTASARQIARFLPVAAADIAVLPNGHEHALAWDPSQARVAPSAVAQVTAKGRSFVLALGSRARHKNMQLLFDAAPGLDELGLDVVIAGGGADIFQNEVLASARNVTMIGHVSDDDLAYLMERALCLMFPSLTEGFGLPIVEAMARGCPVISSDRASMPEVCGDAALLASPTDAAAWVSQARALIGSDALREDLIAKGHERVRLFSWKQTAAGYAELLSAPTARLPMRAVPSMPPSRIAVIVATRGRPDIASATVRHLLRTQSLKPASLIISCVERGDAGELVDQSDATVITGPAGLPTQRNTALAAISDDIEVVAFFDDDFVADKDWLAVAAQTFRDDPDIVGFTGRVLADDVKGKGLGFEEAVRIVEAADGRSSWSWIEPYSPYGCNMAFRRSAIGQTRFDERLVLYGWLEDRDFAAALRRKGGKLVKCAEARGVHMGTKAGRVTGDRFGYSQIVNPIYMLRKGTMTFGQVADHVFRNVSSNLFGALAPEPFIDRRGRLRGNLMGFADVVRGRIEPERAAAIRPVMEKAR